MQHGQYEDSSLRWGGLSVYAYQPAHRGQAAYLMMLCNEKELRAEYAYGKVRIRSVKKIPLFEELIQRSLDDRRDHRGMTKPVHFWSVNKQLACIGLKEEDCLYVVQSKLTEVVAQQYIGVVPITQKMVLGDLIDIQERIVRKGIKLSLSHLRRAL